ncbi:MAG: nucleoside recognition family protein [Marinomonas gallaica]
MDALVTMMLDAGKSGLNMALYILLPIMVIMLAFMKLLDAKGLLTWVCRKLSPLSNMFGIPGLGMLAALKLTFVGFAAPIASLSIMNSQRSSKRHIAATLAMLFTMSQGNATFPMLALGLNLPVLLVSSLVGGLASAAFTYYLLSKSLEGADSHDEDERTLPSTETSSPKSSLQILSEGGNEGMKIALSMIPMLILALFLVEVLKTIHFIDFLTNLMGPLLVLIHLPETAVLPLVTKYIAGGTAYMGIMFDMVHEGVISVREMNMMAGFATNPFDVAGVAIFAAVGKRVGSVVRCACYGCLVGIVVRGIIHIAVFY